jgi:hypothetical protein
MIPPGDREGVLKKKGLLTTLRLACWTAIATPIPHSHACCRELTPRFGAYESPDRQISWDSSAAAVGSPRKAGSANPIKAYALSVEESPFRFATPFLMTT